MEIRIFLTTAAALVGVMSEEAENAKPTNKTCPESIWPLGDPKRCKEQMSLDRLGVRSDLGVMPGSGWDNLQNEERGLVFKYIYTDCKMTDDGQMLVPDNVFTAPVKLSTQEVYSETFKSWLETTSTTSSSINGAKSSSMDKVGSVTSSFSKEKSEVKTHMIEKSTVAVRAQYRVIRYNVFMKPDSAFSAEFENRLRSIAAHVELRRMDVAVYESQRLIRDFGSHVIMKVVAGAAIVRTDYIEKNYDIDSSLKSDELSLALEANLDTENATGKISAKASIKECAEKMNAYKKHLSYSTTISLGGNQNLMTQLSELNISQWLLGVDKNLVALDRDGEFLYSFITPKALPTIPATIVTIVSQLVQEATMRYYKKNTIYGCTDMNSYGFNPSANVDNGTCFDDVKHPTFGGIYEVIRSCESKCDIPESHTEKPCPEGFDKYMLLQYNGTFKECSSTCVHEVYWCAATSRANSTSHWLFGGIFSTTDQNPVTKNFTCPKTYNFTEFLGEIKICISKDYEHGKRFALPFGGFYSCSSDNPFAGFTSINKCPPDYISRKINQSKACEVHYCVKPNYASKEIAMKRPPFETRPFNYVLKYKWALLDSEEFQVRYPIHHVAGYCIMTGVGCIGILHIASIVFSHVRYRFHAKKKLRELAARERTSEDSV